MLNLETSLANEKYTRKNLFSIPKNMYETYSDFDVDYEENIYAISPSKQKITIFNNQGVVISTISFETNKGEIFDQIRVDEKKRILIFWIGVSHPMKIYSKDGKLIARFRFSSNSMETKNRNVVFSDGVVYMESDGRVAHDLNDGPKKEKPIIKNISVQNFPKMENFELEEILAIDDGNNIYARYTTPAVFTPDPDHELRYLDIGWKKTILKLNKNLKIIWNFGFTSFHSINRHTQSIYGISLLEYSKATFFKLETNH